MIRTLPALLLVLVLASDARAANTEPKKEPASYVKIEAVGTLKTDLVAVGGETTGVEIQTAAGAFELELDMKLRHKADKLKGKSVVVSGMLYVKKGVTRGSRNIIKVTSLKEAK